MYFAYVQSSLKYGIVYWGKIRNLKKYFKLQIKSKKANSSYYKHCKLRPILQKIEDFYSTFVCVCIDVYMYMCVYIYI